MSILNKSMRNSIPAPVSNISREQNPFSVRKSPNYFSQCITAISNKITSICYAIRGKKTPIIFENPIYQKGYTLREENRLTKLDDLIQDNSISTPAEVITYSQLKQDWEKNKELHFGKKSPTFEEAQDVFNFYSTNLDKHPDFFKKIIPTILEILDRPDIYNKNVDDLALLVAFNTSYIDMETYDLTAQQDNSDFQYVKHLITAEYTKHKEAVTRTQAEETSKDKAQRIYTRNKEAIDMDNSLSGSDLSILYKINYLVSSLISDPRYLQQEGLFRRSGVQSKSATLSRNIDAQNFSSPTFQLEESKVNSAISAIKRLQKQLFEQNNTEKHKVITQLEHFKQTGNVKPFAELDYITRICMPLYKEIVNNAEKNKMDSDNVAKIVAGSYLYAYPAGSENSIDMTWIMTLTQFSKKMIDL
ncbi:hypothetical protein AHYW_002572 [Providencia manganoxydans]|uniref:Rho-GAP domain-containing protein n=1 Tax=Providencia stuartii TaxID=588 RepID=A0AAI9DFV5_PROST|nr:hypothetical protein [Providencia stuartii]ELR5115305.1 hypothetical protein [Providencia stuartii]